MTVEWISPIYDRTYGDVLSAENDRDLVNPKGCYNYIDLNRIENNTKYCMEYMLEHKIVRVPPSLAIKTNWTEKDIPTREDMIRIIQNIQLLMDLSNPVITDNFLIIYESTQFTYSLANAIEKNLYVMSTQPELPKKKWLLTIEHGIIQGVGTNSIYLEEEETVTIEGQPYGDDSMYMVFTNWSGNTDDLQYVGDTSKQVTTFTMQYHDSDNYSVTLTANFKTRFPRTLTLHGGTIYDDIGGTTRQFFAGDQILLLANDAETGKVFYTWLGTQEALDNLTGGTEPSTSWLTMPDCDVELTSKYINAGKHKVTVDGTIQGWYDYNETVSISPSPRGDKYSFSHWSGDTAYLDSNTSSSFKMPDVNVSFTSNWIYNYSYNTVTMINGKINGEIKQDNLREGSGQSIVADIAPEGKEFEKWTLEGVGSFSNSTSSSTTFYVGDGNAVITANYKDIPPSHNVTIENENNNGGTRTFSVREGGRYSIDTNAVLADYMFNYWEKDGLNFSSSHYLGNLLMKTEDVVYRAVYRDKKSYNLTVINGSGSGTYKERQSVSISANPAETGHHFYAWSGNYYDINNRWSSNTYIVMPSSDCTVTASYNEDPTYVYHNITVNNGSGSGRYYEGQSVRCYANQAASGYEFSHWSEGDTILSYSSTYIFTMGTSDREITANYKLIPYFTVTVINGKGSGTYIRNSSPTIMMDPAPEGYKFLQWEILEGDDNDVYEPLASTTYIRNLTHDVKVKATYYIPDPEIQYTLTVTRKDGTVDTYNNPVGTQISLTADSPDEGYVFYKWVGDTQYVIDRYADKTIVNMPARNITLQMEYRREGFTTTYHVKLNGGKLLVETSEDGTEKWDIEGEFEERSIVKIKAVDIPIGWKFNGWKNDTDDGKSISTVADLTQAETTLTVEDFDIELTRDVIEREKYSLTVVNGETSGSYHEGDPVAIYFNLENTDTTKYTFVRWTGSDLAYIKLFNGGSFDIFKSGSTEDDAQVIRMPSRNITITGTYTTSYKLVVDNEEIGYYKEGTKVNVSANEIEGKRFLYWKGDVDYIDNKYNPNIVVTIPKGGVNLIAVYHNSNENNYIGYSLTDLTKYDNIKIEDIKIISGNVEKGFIITDSNGHIYVVTDIIDTTCNIMRLTKIQGGGEDGQ